MAELVSTINAHLMARVRDPSNIAHDVANVRTLLSHLQIALNAATAAVTAESTAVFSSGDQPNAIRPLSGSFSGMLRVLRIQYQGEDVELVDWETLANIDPLWSRAAGPRPLMWSMIGRRLFTVTPVAKNMEITVRGIKALTALTSSSQATELPDTYMPALIAMAEELILLRHRLLTSVKPAVEHVDRAIESGTV